MGAALCDDRTLDSRATTGAGLAGALVDVEKVLVVSGLVESVSIIRKRGAAVFERRLKHAADRPVQTIDIVVVQ